MINYDILITGGVGLITSIVSSTVSWFLARKKYNSEIDNTLIGNMQKSLDFYKMLVEDNKERLEEVLKRNDALEDEIKDIRKQMYKMMSSICFNLTCQHRQLTKTKS